MRIAFNPSTVKALITPPNNKDITFDLRGQNIFARGVKFCGTDTNTWRDIKINNVSIGSNTLDLRGSNNTTLTNIDGVVTINSTWRPVVDNLTSDSTTSSLSANQGRVLKALINGKSDSGHTHDDRYLKLTGGTMASNALITFADSGSWGTNKGPQGARGGLYWTGQSDYAKLYAEETAGDNLDLVIQFGDDNSNGLSIRNKSNAQTSYISAGGVITTGTFKGNLDWSYITNKPATATRWPSWNEIANKPNTFTPSNHNHDYLIVNAANEKSFNSAYHNFQVLYARGNNGITGRPPGVDAFGLIKLRAAYGWSGQMLLANGGSLYIRSSEDAQMTNTLTWKTILDSSNYSGILDSRYYTESEINTLLDAKLNRQNLSYGTWNPRGYSLAADYHYNGGDLSISENSGKMYVSIDGQFYQNKGQYRVLDTSDVAGLKDNLTIHQDLSNTDTTRRPLIWGGSSHSNTNNSTGTVYKSYDKLSWQTSSQTLYATNLYTGRLETVNNHYYHFNSDATLRIYGSPGGNTERIYFQAGINNRIDDYDIPSYGGEQRHSIILNPRGGFVGIGDTNPISKLTVAGSITPTTANVYNIGTPGNFYNTIYSRVLCAETTSTSIYHQIAIGYPGHARIDFDEYGGAFYFNKTSSSSRNTIATITLGGLSTTNAITYGFNGLQYFNQSTGTTSGATNNANPYNDWFHIIRMNHGNANGYFVDLATAFHQDAMYFRRIVSGQDNGWRKILHDGNSYVTGGKGVINGTTITQVDNATNADKVDNYHIADESRQVYRNYYTVDSPAGAWILIKLPAQNANNEIVAIDGYGDNRQAHCVVYCGSRYQGIWGYQSEYNGIVVDRIRWKEVDSGKFAIVALIDGGITNLNIKSTSSLKISKTTEDNAAFAISASFFSSSGVFHGNVDWDKIIGKPSSFTPSEHTHPYLPLSGGTLTGALTIDFNHSGGGTTSSSLNVLFNGTHDYGIVAKFHSYGGGNSPAIRFSHSSNKNEYNSQVNTNWSIGMRHNTYTDFAITQDRGTSGWGTVRFAINNSGNVGIGIDSASYKLHVAGDIYTTTGFKKNGSSNSYVLLGGGGHRALSDFASSSHSHNYAANENYGGFTKSGRLPISGFYQSAESESGGNAPWSSWMHLINCQHSNTNNNCALQIAASFYDNNTFKIRVTGNNVNNDWRDIIHSGNIGSQTVANAYHLYINSANTWSTWYQAGQGGQPSWLWGSNDGTNMYVWDPSNFNVNTAQYLRSLGKQNCQTGRTQNYGDVYSYNTKNSNTGAPTSYTSVIGFGRGTDGTVEIAGGWCNTHLYWRSLRDCCDDWYSWRTVLDSSNYTKFINNYYWANVKISTASSTTTSPTVSNLTATSSVKVGDILLDRANEINNSANRSLNLNYRSSGDITLCYGGGNVGIGTRPLYTLDVAGDIYTTTGFKKHGSSNSYVLLGGGGHRALSDFASSSHSHNYAANENYGGFTKSGRLPISGFYQSAESESGGNAPWSSWMHLINCQHSNTNNNCALQIAASFYDNNTFKIRVTGNNVNNDWRDIIHSGNIGSQTVANAYHLYINSANTWSTWYQAGQGGQPSWLWGSNDGTNMYVWDPSNFNVNTAQYLRSLGKQNCQTGRTQNYGDVYSYNTKNSNTGAPTSYTSVIGFGRGTDGTVEIAGGWCNTHLYWRSLRDCCDDWYSWRTVLDSSNYTKFINNYYWANVKISTASSTTTSPTVSNLTATSSVKVGDILLDRANEINNCANRSLDLNYRNSGDITLCYGGGNVGIGTHPLYKLDVAGEVRSRGFRYAGCDSNDYILLAGGGYSKGVPVKYWSIVTISIYDSTYAIRQGGNYKFLIGVQPRKQGSCVLTLQFPKGYNHETTMIWAMGWSNRDVPDMYDSNIYATIVYSGSGSEYYLNLVADNTLNNVGCQLYFMCL